MAYINNSKTKTSLVPAGTIANSIANKANTKVKRSALNMGQGSFSLNYPLVRKLMVALFAVMFPFSQVTAVMANEMVGGNIGAANATAHHHVDAPNYVNAVQHSLATINPNIVNPTVDIANVLHSVVNSSLDLNSVLHSVNVGQLGHEVTITAGNHNLSVLSNQALTPAEAVAVSQMLSNNHQALVLDALGQATGGSLNASTLGSHISNLQLSNGVTLVDNSGKLIVNGDLANYGDIVFSGSGNLQANAILNESTGLISSSGTLGLTTNALINEGGIYGATGININAPVIYNAGTIEAGLGNINIANANTLDLTGTQNSIFETGNGNINIDVNSSSITNGMNLAYGNYISNELNLNAGSGYVQGATGNVTGQININANSAHLASSSKDMVLGNDLVNGDPTYVNTAGNITIAGSSTSNGNNVAIIASGSINVSSGSSASISTQGTTSAGGNLVMIAGVGSNVSGGGGNTYSYPNTPAVTTVTVALGATSGNTGGNIDLVTGNFSLNGSFVINTAGNGTNTPGGAVTLIAVPNSITGSGGQILTSNGTTSYGIETNGTGSAYNGNVLIVAGGLSSGLAVELGAITTTLAGTGGGGNVSIYSALPNIQTVSFDTNGTQSAAITINTSNLITSDIVINGNITAPNVTASGVINLATAGQILTGTNTITGNTLNVSDGLGNFGSAVNQVLVDVSYLGVNVTNGSAYLSNSNNNPVTLNTSAVSNGNTFSLTSTGSIIINGTVSAGSDTGSGVIDLVSNPGTITQSINTDVLTAGFVILNASYNIGTQTDKIYIDTASANILISNTGSPGIYVNDISTGNVNLYLSASSSTATSGTFDFSTQGNLVINNNITLGTDTSTSLVQLQANGSIIQGAVPPNTPNIIQSGTVNLITNGGNIGSLNNYVVIDAGTVNISTGGITGSSYVFDNSQNDILINQANTGTGSNDVFAFGGFNGPTTYITEATGLVITAGQVIIASQNGDIGLSSSLFNINSNLVTLNASSNNVYVNDSASGNIILTNILAQGNNVNNAAAGLFEFNANNTTTAGNIETANASNIAAPLIELSSTLGFIGTSSNALNINTNVPTPGITTDTLTLTSAKGAYVADTATNSLSLMASNVGNNQTLELSNAGSIVVSGLVQAGSDNGTGSISLTASGSGTLTSLATGDNLQASIVNLTTTGGNIGSGTANFLVDAGLLSVNTGLTVSTASAYVSNVNTAQMDLSTSQVGNAGTIDVVANGGILVGGFVTAGSASGTGVIDLSANGTGSITSIAGLTAGTVNLTTAGGNIGNSVNPLSVDSNTLSVNTGSTSTIASAYVIDIFTGSLALNASSVGSVGTLDVSSNGSIVVSGILSAGSDTGLGIINLTASGTGGGITQAQLTDTITAGSVNLLTAGGNIGSSTTSLTMNANTLSVNTGTSNMTASAYVSDAYTGSLSLKDSSVGDSGTLSVVATGAVVLSGPVSAGSDSGSGTINLTAGGGVNGTITQLSISDLPTAGTVNLVTAGGNIGSFANNLTIDTSNLSVNTGNTVTTASAYLTDSYTGNVNLNASSVGSAGTLDFTANGIVVNGAIAAGIDNGTGTVSLTVGGTSNISQTANIASIAAGSINFTTAGGNIGTVNNAMFIDSNNVGINTGGATGSSFIQDFSSNNITITQANTGVASGDVFGFAGYNSSTTNLVEGNGVVITAPQAIIVSVNGNIGTSGNLFNIDSNTVTLNATSNSVYANDNASGDIMLTNFTGQGNLVGNAAAGVYEFNANNSTTAGNIETANGSTISAPQIVLASNLGSIGTATSVLNINTNIPTPGITPDMLTLTSAQGAYVADSSTNSLSLMASNVGNNQTLELSNAGSIVVSGLVQAGSDNGTGSISLTASGSGTLTTLATGDNLQASIVNLTTTGGNIGSGTANLLVDAGLLSVNTGLTVSTASAYVSNVNTAQMDLSTSQVGNAGTINLVANGGILVSGSVTAGSASGTGVIDLSANGTGNILAIASADSLTAGTVSLTTADGNIGSSGISGPVYVNTNTLSLNTGVISTVASAYVDNAYTGSLTLNTTTVGTSGTLAVVTGGSLVVNGFITAGTDSGLGIINLTTSGTGSLTQASNNDVVTAGTVNLTTAGSDIGSFRNNFYIDANNVGISTGGVTGSSYVFDNSLNNTTITLANTGVANGDIFEFTANNANPDVSGILTGILTGSGVTITAPQVIISSQLGFIGTNSNLFSINSNLITLNGDFNVYANDSAAGNILLTNVPSPNPNIPITNFALNTFELNATNSTNAGNLLTESSVSANINAASIILASTLGSIGSSLNHLAIVNNTINPGTLAVTAAQNAYITDASTTVVTLNASSVGNNQTFTLSNAASIVVNGLVSAVSDTGTGAINLTATGTGTITTNATDDNLQAGTVNLVTTGGNLGSNSNNVLVDTSNLTVNTGNSVTSASGYVSDVNTASLNLNTSSVGSTGTLAVTAVNSIAVNGLVIAGADNGAGTVNLTANGTGSITQTGNTNFLVAGNVNLQTNGVSIGSVINPMLVDSDNVGISTGGATGSAYVLDYSANTINITNANTGVATGDVFGFAGYNGPTTNLLTNAGVVVLAPQAIIVSINGNIGSANSLFALNSTTVTLNATANNVYVTDSASGSITLATVNEQGNLVGNAAAGLYEFNATNGSIFTAVGNSIDAPSINLSSSFGSIGSSSQAMDINTNQLTQPSSNLTITSALGAYVTDSSTNPLNLQASNVGKNQTLTLSNGNAIVISGNISAGTDSGTGVINLTTSGVGGTITQAVSTDVLTAGSVNLLTDGASIGLSTAPLAIDANTLGFNTGSPITLANVYVSDAYTGNLALTSSSVGETGTLSVSNAGGILVSGFIQAGIDTGSGVIDLTAGGTGNITNAGTSDVLTAGTINLVTAQGNIGVSSVNSLLVDTSNLSLTTGNIVQSTSAYLSDSYTGNVNLNASSVGSAGTLDLTAANGIVINGVVTAGLDSGVGNINLTVGGAGTITQPSFLNYLQASSIGIVTAGGNIGSLSNEIIIDSNFVGLSTGGSSGSAYVFDNSVNNITINKAETGTTSGDVFAFAGNNSSITSILESNAVVITAPQVVIVSVNGNIGTSSNLFNIDSNTVTLNATSNSVYANDNASGDIMLTNFTGQGNLVGNAAAGVYEFNANNSTTAGNIETANGSTISAPQIVLASNLGSIGTATSVLNINTNIPTPGITPDMLTLTSAQGAYVADSSTNSLSLMASNVGNNQTLELSNAGSIVVSGVVQTGSDNGTGSISLTASGSGTLTSLATGDNLQAGSVNLTTTGGNIGSGTANLLVDAGLLSVNTGLTVSTASAYVSNVNTAQMDLSTSQVGNAGTIDVVANGGILVGGFVTAGSASGTGVIDLSANGTGSITSIAGLTAGTVNLTTAGGNIGNSANPLSVDSNTLSVNTGSTSTIASAYVIDIFTGSLALNASSVGSVGTLDVSSNGSIVVSGILSAGSDTGLGIINLTASGTGGGITQAQLTDTITAGSVNLLTAGGNIGSSTTSLTMNANTLSVNTGTSNMTASAYVSDAYTGSLSLKDSSVGDSGTLSVVATGAVVLSGPVSAGSDSGSGTINLTAGGGVNGTITQLSISDLPTAGTVNLVTAGGNIGSFANNLTIDTSNLSVNTGNTVTTASAYLTDSYTGNVNLNASSVGSAGTLDFTANGIVVNGAIAAGIDNGTGTVSLTVGGTSNISQTANIASIAAGSINFTTAGGNIGTVNNAMFIDSNNVGINTGGATGSSFIQDFSSNNITITQANTGVASGDVFGFAGYNSSTTNLVEGNGVVITAPQAIIVSVNGNIGTSGNLFNIDSNTVTLNATSNSVYANDNASGSIVLTNFTGQSNLVTNAAAGVYEFNANNSTTAGNIETASGSSIAAPGIILTSSLGSIGSGLNPVNVNTSELTQTSSSLTLTAAQSAYVTDTSTNVLYLLASSVGVNDTLSLSNTNSIAVGGLVTAGTDSGSGVIDLSVSGNSSTLASLSTNYILQSGTIDLTTAGGNIGANTTPLLTDTNNLSVTTGGINGSAFINDASTNTVVLGPVLIGTGTNVFALSANNSATTGIVLATGTQLTIPTLVLSSVAGNLGTNKAFLDFNANNVTLSAGNGNVYANDSALGTITLQNFTLGTATLTNSAIGVYELNASNLSASGNIVSAAGASVTAQTVILNSTLGSLGSSSNPLSVNTDILSLNSTQNVYVVDTSTNTLVLNASSAGAAYVFSLSNAGSILVSGLVTAGTDSGSGVIDLSAGGSGTITQAANTDTLQAGTINLLTTGGNIGSLQNSLSLDANSISANTGNSVTTASAYLNDIYTGNTSLNGSSVGSAGILTVTVANGLVINGLVNAGLDSGTGIINLNASGTGNISQTVNSDELIAGNINLVTAGGNVGTITNYIALDANNVGVNTGGVTGNSFVYDFSTNNITITHASTGVASGDVFGFAGSNSSTTSLLTGNAVVITAPQAIIVSVNGNIGTSSNLFNINSNLVTLNATSNSVYANDLASGNIVLTTLTQLGNLVGNAAAGVYELNANNSTTAGSILTTNVSNIVAPSIILTSVLGSIGSSINPVNVNTNQLTQPSSNLTLTSAQGAYIVDTSTNSLNLQASNVGNNQTLSLSNTNSIVVAGLVAAGNDNGTGVINLTASATGTLSTLALGDNLQAGVVNLNTSGGNIGSTGTNLAVDANSISVNTGYTVTSSSAYINDIFAGSLNLNASVVGNTGVLTVNAASSILVNGVVMAGNGAGTGTVNLLAQNGGSIMQAAITDTLQCGTLNLTTTGGDIGSSTANLAVSANTLSVNTGAVLSLASAYINNNYSGLLTLNASAVGTSGTLTINTLGSIVVNGLVAAGSDAGLGTINLTTGLGGSIITVANTDILQAGNINIVTDGGSLGVSATNPLYIDTAAINVKLGTSNKFASAFLSDSYNGVVNIGGGSGGNVSVGSNGIFSLVMTNPIGGGIYITSSISVGTDSGNGIINLSASGTGAITEASGQTLTAGFINLVTQNQNIGAIFTALNVDTQNLTLNNTYNGSANNALANVTDIAGSVNLGASSVGSTLTLVSSGSITTTGFVNAAAINLTANNNGNITFDSTVGNANTFQNITANGTGYILTGTGGLVVGNTLTMQTASGEIGFGVGGNQPLYTQASNIIFNAGLSVGINNNSASLNVGTSNSGANVYVETSGTMTASGTITAPVLGLYSFGGSTGIGSANSYIQVNAHNLGLQSYGNGSSIYVNDNFTGNTVMQQSQASNTLAVNVAGSLTIYAQINQGGVVTPGIIGGQVVALASGGGFGIYNDGLIQASNFAFLTASQTGYIAEPGTGANMVAPNLALVSGGGTIGAGGTLMVNSGMIAVSTQGLGGINVTDNATTTQIVGAQAGANIVFNTGNLNVLGNIATGAGVGASGGSISFSGNGFMNIGTTAAIGLIANNGSVSVTNNNLTGGSIYIANGSNILGSSFTPNVGYVAISIGPANAINTTNPNPSLITVLANGANVFFGNNGIRASAGGNVLNAAGRNIIFNTGNLGASAITLQGNVKITADPPVVNSGIAAIQNNLTAFGVYNENPTANNQANSNQSVANVLDNNQAGLTTNSNAQVKQSMDTKYLTNNSDENNEIIENTSLIMPIAYNHEVAGLSIKNTSKACGLNFNGINNESATLGQGSAVISASHDMVVTLGVIKPVKLSLKRGAIVLAIANGSILSVYNLHDSAKDSVLVNVKGIRPISLAPGKHLSLANASQSVDFAFINQVSKIGYRNVNAHNSNGISTYLSDFSIPSAISAIKPLKAMFRSNDKQIKAIANQLLKTSCVVTQSTSSAGVYEQVTKPKYTAMQ